MNELVETKILDSDKERIRQKFKELFKNVALDSPNPDQVEELKQFIQENPSIFRETYNFSNMVVDNLLSLPEMNQTLRAVIKESLKDIKNQFGYSSSSIIEKMVIDSIIVSWVRLQYLELVFTKAFFGKEFSIQSKKQYDNLLNSAHKRYLRSIDSLVRIRKIGVNLKINIANNVGTQNVH